MQFNNTPAPLTLRANRLRITPRGASRRLAALDDRGRGRAASRRTR